MANQTNVLKQAELNGQQFDPRPITPERLRAALASLGEQIIATGNAITATKQGNTIYLHTADGVVAITCTEKGGRS